jgi:hypothetical protein
MYRVIFNLDVNQNLENATEIVSIRDNLEIDPKNKSGDAIRTCFLCFLN